MLTFIRVASSRIRAVFRTGDLERDFDDELKAHLIMAEDEMIRQGMSRKEARRAARVLELLA